MKRRVLGEAVARPLWRRAHTSLLVSETSATNNTVVVTRQCLATPCLRRTEISGGDLVDTSPTRQSDLLRPTRSPNTATRLCVTPPLKTAETEGQGLTSQSTTARQVVRHVGTRPVVANRPRLSSQCCAKTVPDDAR